MKVDIEELKLYKMMGRLISQRHPSLPLTIWNYSKTEAFNGKWDDITLMCRGLVTDDEGNVVAKPFGKFFNESEKKYTPTDTFDVYEKLDGSLGISFYYEGEWIFASRGSFTSEQAIKGKEMFDRLEKYALFSDITYIWEIIYPENRIVVDYGDQERLILLGMIQTETGEELSLNGIRLNGKYDVVKEYGRDINFKDFYNLKLKHEDDGIEGFVIKFKNGERIKVKYDEYVRLHNLVSQISTKSIWKCLSRGDNMEGLITEIPDEFYDKIKDYILELKGDWYDVYSNVYLQYESIIDEIGYGASFFDFAYHVKDMKYKHLLFHLKRGNVRKLFSNIWKIVEPEYKQL